MLILSYKTGTQSYDAVVSNDAFAYWKFSETSGTTATDSAGSNDGTYVGGPNLSGASLVPNQSESSVTITSSSEYVSLPSILDQEEKTIEFWISIPGGNPIYSRVLTNNSGYTNRCVIAWGDANESNSLIFATNDGTEKLARSNPMTLNQTYHIVAAVNNTGDWTIYQDGSLVSNPASIETGWLYDAGTGWRLGRRHGGLSPWSGTVDSLSFYTSELSAGQALAHYNAGL